MTATQADKANQFRALHEASEEPAGDAGVAKGDGGWAGTNPGGSFYDPPNVKRRVPKSEVRTPLSYDARQRLLAKPLRRSQARLPDKE
jgi:hypothetical protein